MKHKILTFTMLLFLIVVCISMTTKYKSVQEDNWEVPKEFQSMKNPYSNAKDTEEMGKMLYLKHCKMCHGDYGKGDGKMANLMDIEVGNFTTEAFKAQTDGAIYYKFLNGRNEMPAFKTKIKNPKDRWLLINYLRKLGQ